MKPLTDEEIENIVNSETNKIDLSVIDYPSDPISIIYGMKWYRDNHSSQQSTISDEENGKI